MTTKRFLIALLCTSFLWTVTPAAAQLGVGDLDSRLRVPVTEKIFPETDAVLLLDDIKFEVHPDRSHTFDEHDAMKVLTKEGVDENATLVRVVDRSQSQVEVLMARTIKADGRVLKASPPQYSSLAPDSEVYDSVSRFSLRFQDVEVGDIVEFHLRTTHKPKPGGHFWATTYVQNPMPILDSTFTVTVPEGVFFQTSTPGHPDSEPEKSVITKDGQEYQKLFWQIEEEAAFEFKPLSPKAISLLKRIEVSSFKDWAEVADYLKRGWTEHSLLGEGLLLRVAGWMPSTGNMEERASQLMKELNRSRKVASFLAEEPEFHDPSRVFELELTSGFDTSLLSSVALSSVGIQNIPIATMGVNEKSLSDELPIPEKVEKIILEIPRVGGTSLWFDPDAAGFILDNLPPKVSDTAALSWDARFEPGVGRLVDLRLASAYENREELAMEGRLDKSGRAELTVQFDRYGTSALDSRQAARDIAEGAREARDRALATFFRNTARAYGPRARLLNRYFELDPDAQDPFTLSFTVAVPGYAQRQGDTLLVPLPRFLSAKLRAATRERNRTIPLVFEQPFQQDIRIHLIFPEGSEVTEAPELIQEQTPEAEFVATGRVEGNEAWYVGRLTVLDPWIEEQDLHRNLQTLTAALESEDTILKVELAPGNESEEETEIEDEEEMEP